MDTQFLNYLKTVNVNQLQRGNNIFGSANSNPIRQVNYGGKNYWLAPEQSMEVGPGGYVKLSDDIWNSGYDAENTLANKRTEFQRALARQGGSYATSGATNIADDPWAKFKIFEQDPLAGGGYSITPGTGSTFAKDMLKFAAIAAPIVAMPFLAGGAAAGAAGGGASAAAPTTGVGSTGAGIGGAGGAGGVAAAGGGGGSAAGGVAGTSLLPSGSAYGGSLGLTMPAAGATTGSGITAGGTGVGLSAPLAGGGTLTAGGTGALGGIGGFLNSIGQALGGLSGSQVLQGGLGLGDLAMRLWQQNELGNIANEAASRSDPMNQPQRFPYQQLANQYATGGQNIMTQPMVKAAYDLGMNDVMAKTAKFSDSGQAWKAIADNSNKTFQSSALPYLDWLGTMGGFKQGPGYAGNLYGQYASQATGAPFLGINSLVSGFNANNNANTGVNNYFADFFKDYQRASRTPSWNASLYTQA